MQWQGLTETKVLRRQKLGWEDQSSMIVKSLRPEEGTWTLQTYQSQSAYGGDSVFSRSFELKIGKRRGANKYRFAGMESPQFSGAEYEKSLS